MKHAGVTKRRGGGRYPIPADIGGWSVAAMQMRIARAVTAAVTERIASGETTPTEVAKRMGSRPHLVARLLAEPERLGSLRHVVGLAAAAGLRVDAVVATLEDRA